MTLPLPFDFVKETWVNVDNGYIVTIPKGITTVGELMNSLSQSLQFPSYFGFNWDALSDCLRDFHWIRAHTIVVQHMDIPQLPLSDLRVYLEVLAEAAASWGAEEEHALRVLFPSGTEQTIEFVMMRSP